MNAGLIVFIVLIVLAFLGLPIFEAIAAGTMLAMWFGGFWRPWRRRPSSV